MKELAVFLVVFSLAVSLARAEGNARLKQLVDEDQSDRQAERPELVDWTRVRARDEERSKEVLALVHSGSLATSDDYFGAALIFQHGATTEDASLAYAFATVASRLQPVHPRANWLQAAAWDRLMLRKKRPQWYGTQYVTNKAGKWVLYDMDETAVTDEERARMGVPNLSAVRQRVKEMNGEK